MKLYIGYSNNISSEGAIRLSKDISKLSNLKCLKLKIDERNSIGEAGASSLGKALQNLKKLMDLYIEINKNAIGGNGA